MYSFNIELIAIKSSSIFSFVILAVGKTVNKYEGVNVVSLNKIKTVFQNLNNGSKWSLQLINIKTSKKSGTGYSCRQITLSSSEQLSALINEIATIYIGHGKKSLELVHDVREYDGTADALVVYKLSTANELIASEYASFLQVIADPNTENDPFEYTSAYLLRGQLVLDEETTPIKLISMQNPVTTLKHKYCHNKGTFKELSDKVLTLRPTMDVLVVGEMVYFLTLAGENLFNMARSYKAVCHQKVEEVEQADIISGIYSFKTIAESGHNPRKFIAFNDSRLNALKKKSVRVAMAKRFSIPWDDAEDKFDATAKGASEKIVKLLCNKGMIDPFEKTAVEVDGARQWQ